MAFWRLYYHLVWATKNREHFIQPAIEDSTFISSLPFRPSTRLLMW